MDNYSGCTSSLTDEDQIYSVDEIIILPTDNDLDEILKQWSLESILPKLLSKNITLDSFQYLTELELSSIFHDDLGNKARFRAMLLEWRVKNNFPAHSSTLNDSVITITNGGSTNLLQERFTRVSNMSFSPSPLSLSPSVSPLPSSDFFVLANFLTTPAGAKINSMYQDKNPPQFTPELRDLLCTHIARFFVENNKSMTINDFRNVTTQIIDRFPEENPDYYFSNIKHPTGKLYNKYRVIQKNLSKVGYFTDSKRRRNKVEEVEVLENVTDTAEELTDITKDWLKVHNQPWEVVEQKWKITYDIRSKELSKSKDSASFINEWPLYQNTKGFRLIEIDFELKYTDTHGQLFKKWITFKNQIGEIFKKKLKDKLALQICDDLSTEEDIGNIQICKLMHYILKPSGKHKQHGVVWKFTINDSIQSFLIEVIDPAHIQEKVHNTKSFCISRNLTLQPFIIYINNHNPQFCVVYDEIIYTFDQFLVALDVCFKTFFVFKLSYPNQSEKFWLFIQKYFYNITTPFDKITPDLVDVISQLE